MRPFDPWAVDPGGARPRGQSLRGLSPAHPRSRDREGARFLNVHTAVCRPLEFFSLLFRRSNGDYLPADQARAEMRALLDDGVSYLIVTPFDARRLVMPRRRRRRTQLEDHLL